MFKPKQEIVSPTSIRGGGRNRTLTLAIVRARRSQEEEHHSGGAVEFLSFALTENYIAHNCTSCESCASEYK